MVGFCYNSAMNNKIISYGIAHIFFNLIVWNILCISHNYGMFILIFIIIGLTFIIIFNFHRFKSFFLSLFIWSYFTIKWSLFSPFLFRGLSCCRPIFFVIFNGCLCWEFMWVYVLFFLFLCWLCPRFPSFRSFLEFLLTWDFFSFLKLC